MKLSRQNVEALLAEVATFLKIAGVPEQQINVAEGLHYKVHHYARAFDWLHEFILSNEMSLFRKIRALRPEKVWEHYSLIGVEGLAEQVLLKEASQRLLERWRLKRPRMFGPNREIQNGDVQQDQTNPS